MKHESKKVSEQMKQMLFEKESLENKIGKGSGGIKRKHHSKVPSINVNPLRSPNPNIKADTFNPTPRS